MAASAGAPSPVPADDKDKDDPFLETLHYDASHYSLFLQAGAKAHQYTNGPWYTRPALFRVIDFTGTNHFGLDTNNNFFYVNGGLTNATAYNGFVTFSNAAGPKILFFRNGVMFSTNYSGQAF